VFLLVSAAGELFRGHSHKLIRVTAAVFHSYYLVAQTGLHLLGSSCVYVGIGFREGGEIYSMVTIAKLNMENAAVRQLFRVEDEIN
jgi:hypothetical protein